MLAMSDCNLIIKKLGRPPKKYIECSEERKERNRKKIRDLQRKRYRIDPEYRKYKICQSRLQYYKKRWNTVKEVESNTIDEVDSIIAIKEIPQYENTYSIPNKISFSISI